MNQVPLSAGDGAAPGSTAQTGNETATPRGGFRLSSASQCTAGAAPFSAQDIARFWARWSGTGPLTLELHDGRRVVVHGEDVLAAPWFGGLAAEQRESLALMVADWRANEAASSEGGAV